MFGNRRSDPKLQRRQKQQAPDNNDRRNVAALTTRRQATNGLTKTLTRLKVFPTFFRGSFRRNLQRINQTSHLYPVETERIVARLSFSNIWKPPPSPPPPYENSARKHLGKDVTIFNNVSRKQSSFDRETLRSSAARYIDSCLTDGPTDCGPRA